MRQIAQTVLDQIERRGEHVPEITIEPEFVVRNIDGTAQRRWLRTIGGSTQHLEEGHLSD